MRNLNRIVIIAAGAAGLTTAESLRRLRLGTIMMAHDVFLLTWHAYVTPSWMGRHSSFSCKVRNIHDAHHWLVEQGEKEVLC